MLYLQLVPPGKSIYAVLKGKVKVTLLMLQYLNILAYFIVMVVRI